ncbi:hypothetical protein PGT21_031826 [Puccinia graminis f. sp. tritici]|uniref:Uncharacterized protein n=1 Tax=Puccinia graminis f. sp. tritici TaxID=56615 RepID=A0A5B0MPU8_PUCGR|nr:hypothetical protein PGTUg99_006334 [Puccinia graminis f. sp. tritici]KAA1094872.1 hypothetical protein PGT21_031826 [Puccinia graminis f. sp. tritici]
MRIVPDQNLKSKFRSCLRKTFRYKLASFENNSERCSKGKGLDQPVFRLKGQPLLAPLPPPPNLSSISSASFDSSSCSSLAEYPLDHLTKIQKNFGKGFETSQLLRESFESLSESFQCSPSESISKPREFREYFERIPKSYRKVFERPSESLSHRIAKCTWTKVQDVRPCGRIFRNISERTSEMFRTPAPVVYSSASQTP